MNIWRAHLMQAVLVLALWLPVTSCSNQDTGQHRVFMIGDVTMQAEAARAGNNRQQNQRQARQGQGQPGQNMPQGARPQGQPGQGMPQGTRPEGQPGQGMPQGARPEGQPGQGMPQGARPQGQPTGTGWGAFFTASLNADKIQSRITAGMHSSRSFYESQWTSVKDNLTAGDFVIIQLGAFDSSVQEDFTAARTRGSLPGSGDETQAGAPDGNGNETSIHTYGWYLAQMTAEAKAKGASVIVCSPSPRQMDGKVVRSTDYAVWAKEAADKAGACFIDLNNLVADAIEAQGDVASLFETGSEFLTTKAGAYLTASVMYRALKQQHKAGLAKYLADVFPSLDEMDEIIAKRNTRRSVTPNLLQSAEAKKKFKKLSPKVPARQGEKIDRGTVAILQDDGKVFVSWRLFAGDPGDIAFNVYRRTDNDAAVKLNTEPIADVTWYLDTAADTARQNTWFVTPVTGGTEGQGDTPFTLAAHSTPQPYISIPLQTPEGYSPGDASAGDLDGDGQYEIVVKQTRREYDNSQSGVCTGTTKLEAYKLDGTFMWRIDLGVNIREGAHYTQFSVFDFDGDGRAEVICKTSEGTTDGTGMTIGDTDGDGITSYVNPNTGYILDGPEFFSVFDGLTGKELARENFIARGPKEEWNKTWGDTYGNRIDRYLSGVGFFDGERPSVLLCRGYYGRAVLEAWNWRDGRLTRIWRFDTEDETQPDNKTYRGQGNHNLSIADVDNDGKDEVLYGACAIDHDGQGLYNTRIGHGDAMHVSDLDPDRPGLELFQPHESAPNTHGIEFRDARTGESLWGAPSTDDVGRGLAADIDPRYRGSECWGSGMALYNAKGEKISDKTPSSTNFAIWWDGDLLRELLDRNAISKWDWENQATNTLFTAIGCRSNNGTKATPNLTADLLGDWREELVLATNDNQELRIFTTTIPTSYRFYTFMQDHVYRLGVAWQNTAYNQPPHTSFFLGDGVEAQPVNRFFFNE